MSGRSTTRRRMGRAGLAGLLVAAFIASGLAAGPVLAVDLIGQRVDLTYDFGDDSGTLSGVVGPGVEFVLEGDPSTPGFSRGSINIIGQAITLTHNRNATLGPSTPVVSDDFLSFSFPDLPSGAIGNVTLTADPIPGWFGGELFYDDRSVSLQHTDATATVNTLLKVWTIAGPFLTGAIADADEVNASFESVRATIDGNDARITAREGLLNESCPAGEYAFGFSSDGTLRCAPATPPPLSETLQIASVPASWSAPVVTPPCAPGAQVLTGGIRGTGSGPPGLEGACYLSGVSTVTQGAFVVTLGPSNVTCTPSFAMSTVSCECIAVCD